MRLIIAFLFMFIVAIISLPLYLVAYILKLRNPMTCHKFSQQIVRIVFRILLFISGVKVDVYGLEKIDTNDTYLYVSNHRSFFDAIVSYTLVPTPTAYVAKNSIKKMPCIAQWMYFLRCMFLDRADIKNGLEMIKKSITLINEGISVYIAPEGTRNAEPTLLPFKEGSFKIATRTNCKIVPICYTNTENIFETHMPWIRKAHITIEFGEPVDITELTRDEKKTLGVRFNGIIQNMYDSRA